MEIKQMLVSSSKYNMLCPYEMNPTEITIHNTYNDATALNERNNVANNSTGTSFHIAVDDKEVIQLIPFNRNAWHSGDGSNGRGNRHSIGIEICYSMSGGERYRKAELNAIQVIKQLMKQFNIPVSKVKTHQERNGKYCPHRMLDEGRVEWFKQQLVSGSVETSAPESKPKPQSNGYDSSWFTNEDGVFTANTRVNVRTTSPSGPIEKTLNVGDKIRYNGFGIELNGHVWLRCYLGDGKYVYVASGESRNGKRINYWGTFK